MWLRCVGSLFSSVIAPFWRFVRGDNWGGDLRCLVLYRVGGGTSLGKMNGLQKE